MEGKRSGQTRLAYVLGLTLRGRRGAVETVELQQFLIRNIYPDRFV